eukprot:TRINITY_DN888_c0_g1_i1.p1 TRINITY_DN888_c0_g1~~TRINITY_DN888_c0_g1_i1.p1  ORF type:complete len:268 (+),score=47.23 TRINITY_DN888_c0_g1_i1:64-867(+)
MIKTKTIVFTLVFLFLLALSYRLGRLRNDKRALDLININELLRNEQILKEVNTEAEKTETAKLQKEEQNPKIKQIETVSWKPRAQLFHNFLHEDECNYVMKLVTPSLTRSLVVGDKGQNIESKARTSMGTFIIGDARNDPVIKTIETRIADWTQIPEENGEALYVLRYEKGQYYKAHHDFFLTEEKTKRSGDRIATVLMYLAAPEEGGETRFPQTGLKVKVRKGDALLFWDYNPDGSPDPLSLHESLPVVEGTKWCMTKWIHSKKYI